MKGGKKEMEENNKWVGLVILAIVAIIAIVGLVLLFKANITGNILVERIVPTIGELGLNCVKSIDGTNIFLEISSGARINEAAQLCREAGGHLTAQEALLT